jgi:hypothetical protein
MAIYQRLTISLHQIKVTAPAPSGLRIRYSLAFPFSQLMPGCSSPVAQ